VYIYQSNSNKKNKKNAIFKMTDLIRNYCYPLEQQKAAGHPSSNFSLFLKTGKLSHLCASSYTSVLPAAASKSSKGSEKLEADAVARPDAKKLKADAAESKQQLPVTPIIFANEKDELYKIKNIGGPALKTEVLSTFFVNPQTEGDSTGEVITLYKSRTIHGAATFFVDDLGFTIFMRSTDPLNPKFKGNLEQIRGGTICKKETITFITLLCERLWLDALYVDIIHLQISRETIDFKKERHGKKGVAINGVISCLFPKEIKCFYMKKNEVHITKIDYNQLNETDEKTIPCVGITSFARSKIGQNNPCVIYGDDKGDIYKLDFAPKKKFKVNIELQEKSGSILHICCGHPKNITYKEFYYATEKYLYFDTYDESTSGTSERSRPIRRVPIPENWKIKQLMCTQNEERIIALLSSSKKDGNSQTEIMIIPNLKPSQSSTIRFANMKINQWCYYFGNSWKNVIITVLDNEKLCLIDGKNKNDFSLILENMETNSWRLKKEFIPKIGDTQTNDTKERQKRRADTQPKNTLEQQMSYYLNRRAARNYDAPERTSEEIQDIFNTIASAEHRVTAFLELSRVCMNTQRIRIDDSLKWFYYIRNFKWPDELQKTYTEHYITFFINWFNNLKDSDNVKFTENSFVDDIAIFEIGPTPKIEPANPELAEVFQKITSLFIKYPRRRMPELMKIFYTAIEDDNEYYNEDLIRVNFNTIDKFTVKKLQNLFSKEKLKTEEILFNERKQGIYDKINRLYDRRHADEAMDIIFKLRDKLITDVLNGQPADITQESADQLEEFLKDKRGQTDEEWAEQEKYKKANPSPVELPSDDELPSDEEFY